MIRLLKKIIKNLHRLDEVVWDRYRRLISARLKKIRPSSAPFISGDSFREIADHVFDLETNYFDINKIKNNDKVFVELRVIKKWFNEYHKNIKARYVLISHNGDEEINQELASRIDDRIIKWYSQNVNFVHPKLVPIPIGLENMSYYNNGIIKNYKRFEENRPTINKIIFGFNVNTNLSERIPAAEFFKKYIFAEKINGNWPTPTKYLKMISKYKFIASPPGNGIDCIRTWESMYLNIVPIVKKSILTEYFSNLGIPMMVVDRWDEVVEYDEKMLGCKYDEIIAKADKRKLYFDYWQNKINNLID